MYYSLWKKLYKKLIEEDPENEVIRIMELMENEKIIDEYIEQLIKELED